MEDIINYVKDHSLIFIIIGSLLLITIYSVIAVFINKLSNAKHGKTTKVAWIFPLNIVLLGQLAVHWSIGLLLFIGLLFFVCISFNIPGLEMIHDLLPSNLVLPYQIGYGVILLLIFIIGKIKLNRIVREGTSRDSSNAFINKDFDKKEEKVVVETNKVDEVEEMIKDNYQYNHTSLSSLNNHNDENK